RGTGAAPRGGRGGAQSDGRQPRGAAAYAAADGREARRAVARAGTAAVPRRGEARRGRRRALGREVKAMGGAGGGCRAVLVVLAALAQGPALAFGPAGHRIAGELAEPLACTRAAEAVAGLTGGERLAGIGLWADTIRGDEAWRHTAPWHYMNIDDGTTVERFEHPPEGDVLWAIGHYAARLAEPLPAEERAEALRFLVHFIVDVHQPLHVGRESDRGGNALDVTYRGETSNLHRFWDTGVLRLEGLSEAEYSARVAPLTWVFVGRDATSPRD